MPCDCKVVFTSAAHGATTRDGASDARGSATGGWATLGVRALRGCASHADSLFLQTHQQTNTHTNKQTHRYKMLLAEILKATHAAHPHHARLSLALSMVTETAHIVNEAVTTRTCARACV